MQEPFLDWLAIINILGVTQGVFLVLIFFTVRKGNKTAHYYLGLSLLALAFIVFETFLGYTGYLQFVPILVNLEEPVVFLIGPLTYFYTQALLHPEFRFSFKKHIWHFIPFLFQFVTRMPFYLQSNTYKLQDAAWAFHKPAHEWIPAEKIWFFPQHEFLVSIWLDIVGITQILIYIFFCLKLIHQYTEKHNEKFWTANDPSLKWLIRVLALFCFFFLMATIFSSISEDDTGDIYIATSCSIIFYGISVYLISHLQDYSNETQNRRKYEKSVLDQQLKNEIKLKLMRCMQEDMPYLNSELTMPILAEKLSISPHHLSQVINEEFEQNFSDFINQHRIEEMKSRLINPGYSHIKIEQIAYDTGFNSKSTFQAAFKKFTGLTPSAYKKSIAEEH